MSVQSRSQDVSWISPGPYLATIVNHLDPTYMGSLQVTLTKSIPGLAQTETSNVIVKYCSPFFGSTAQKYEGNNSANYDDVQKSYGFWMVPPDIGSTVMVMFVGGDINQGYWFGCVSDMYQNQEVPGIAASQYSAMTEEQLKKYGTRNVPVAEYHKSSRTMEDPNPDKFTKPVHPFADRLVNQGLLIDNIRGVTSSSARREVPSRVFGISTPGPVNVNSPLKEAGFQNGAGSIMLPVSRLGGHQFVMDDGDLDGKNELFRIRTRTGHQILLHNSSDLIYIANSKGSAWIELTSEGKIDVYAQDSVSVHTENDFNFLANRDINLEAGRNLNIKTGSGIDINTIDRFNLICNASGKLNFGEDFNVSTGGEIRQSSAGDSSYISGADMYSNASGDNNATGANWMVSAGTTNISSGHHLESAGKIDMNGPAAASASAGTAAEVPTPLDVFTLPNRTTNAGWANGNFYKAGSITSIMQRVPTHEPWDQHENINPNQFSASNTDSLVSARDGAGGNQSLPSNFNPPNAPLSKNAKANEAYLKSYLIRAGIKDPIKLAAWMAQCKEETGFIYLHELWGPSAAQQRYEGRTDLGNNQPGDGRKFMGRGFLQITGRHNYTAFAQYCGQDVVSHPELVEQLPLASASVLFFFNVLYHHGFKNRKMSQPYTDTTAFWDDCRSVTAMVNGGYTHYDLRLANYNAYKQEFTTKGIGT